MTTRFETPAALLDAVGTDLGAGEWLVVDQARVDAFADATDDHQWIHVDPQRAASGPFGGAVAHGHLTLSLLPALGGSLVEVGGTAMVVNYGFDRVRFVTPVRVGARVRARATITGARATERGVLLVLAMTVEVEGGERPAVVAEALGLYVPA